VALASAASNLVAGDTNGAVDIFLKDTQTGAIIRVSTDAGGSQSDGPSWDLTLSADGRCVAFASDASNLVAGDTNGYRDIFLKDTQTGAVTRLSTDSNGSQANGPSFDPGISADGRYVAFPSAASNLVADDTNGAVDIYMSPIVCSAATPTPTPTPSPTSVGGVAEAPEPAAAPQPARGSAISPMAAFVLGTAVLAIALAAAACGWYVYRKIA
jgi:hypothetical protein